jgi:hypothetical protein
MRPVGNAGPNLVPPPVKIDPLPEPGAEVVWP